MFDPNQSIIDSAEPKDSMHRTFRRLIPMLAAVILVVACLGLFTTSKASEDGIAIRIVPAPNSMIARNQLVDYYARSAYNAEHTRNADTTDTAQMLKSLQEGQPQDKRAMAISTLIQAPPSIIPMLVDALTHPDAGIRRGAAEVLGSRHALEAENSLFFATFDTDAGVRVAAIRALGGLGAIHALPRLQWLEVADEDADVQLAAHLAENQVYWRVAATLGVPPGDLHVIAISITQERVYAATKSDLYTANDSRWERIASLPDIPTTLAVSGNDGQTLYLGTASRGIFRSVDGGRTWQPINKSLSLAGPFAITALAINPENDRQVFMALATNASATPMLFGLYQTLDGGDSWLPLTPSNIDHLTTRLVVDSTSPARLLGLTDAGRWQYLLATAKHEP